MNRLALLLATTLLASAASAGNTLIPANQNIVVAKSALAVAPAREWNKMGARPGRYSETWTIDGDTLNDLTFYGDIPSGRPLFREISKRDKPLPLFSSTMLLTDIPSLLENSYRVALDTPLIAIGKVEPVMFAGHNGVRFAYDFTAQGEDVHRRGEAYATIKDGKLFMITFEAPTLYYFDADIEAARQVVASASLASAGRK
jgi:hypothetical protein